MKTALLVLSLILSISLGHAGPMESIENKEQLSNYTEAS